MKQTTARKAYSNYVSAKMDKNYYVLKADGRLVSYGIRSYAQASVNEFGGELLTAKQAQKRGLVS